MLKKCTICDIGFEAKGNFKCCSNECSKINKKNTITKREVDNKDYKKEYMKEYNLCYYKNNKEKASSYSKRYYQDNMKYYQKYSARYRKDNRDGIKLKQKEWCSIHKEEIKLKRKEYLKEKSKEPLFKLNNNLSSGIRASLKQNNMSKRGRHWEDLVGYTKEDLKEHLESLFTEGMTWGNKGMFGWHIDHIVPKSFFKFNSTDDVEFRYCWSLDNLQPLWAKDNLRKHNKIKGYLNV